MSKLVPAGAALVLALLPTTVPVVAADTIPLNATLAKNPFAYIPPQCWTVTQQTPASTARNPCYACHVDAPEPNFARDAALQTAYDFAETITENPWTNLFADRREQIGAVSDSDILDYVRHDNYRAPDGSIILDAALDKVPAAWDVNADGSWSGYRPDVYFNFDADGFDHAPDGTPTGWRAYAYKPLPGAFWPTNGSADDVAIRLPPAFRERADGTPDLAVYKLNLAILEALIKRKDVPIAPTDEVALGVDLDRDGTLGTARKVTFAYDPLNGVNMDWVGRARAGQEAGTAHLAALLFPEGTEFVHSVRYLDVAKDGAVVAAPRLKELRYARKTGWQTYGGLRLQAQRELIEAGRNPDDPEHFFGDIESGMSNGKAWRLQGFIEDAEGALRPQTYEESLTCMGCHGAIGRNVDSTISFGRKLDDDGAGSSWYRWSAERPLGALADADGEYARYLKENGAADEFRANVEALARFLGEDGSLDSSRVETLSQSVAPLTDPSAERALALDKAYRLIVEEQSYNKGRLPVLAPLDKAVHKSVEPGQPTGIETPITAMP